MKLILFIILTSTLSCNLISQNYDFRQSLPVVKYPKNIDQPLNSKELKQIMEVFGAYAEKEVLSRPQRVRDLKHLLRNRIELKLISAINFKECKLLSEVPLFDAYVPTLKRDVVFNPNNFNPLKYNIDFFSTTPSMYKIDNTNYYLIVKSQHQ